MILFDESFQHRCRRFSITLICHLSIFVLTFQQLCEKLFEERDVTLPEAALTCPGDLEVTVDFRPVPLVAYRVNRRSAKSVVIRDLEGHPESRLPHAKTSGIFQVLCSVLKGKGKTFVWDDFEVTEENMKVMRLVTAISDRGFSWDDIVLERDNPERWTFRNE